MFDTQLIIDADHSFKSGWEIVARFTPEDLEFAWSDMTDNQLRAAAPDIGQAVVHALLSARDAASVASGPPKSAALHTVLDLVRKTGRSAHPSIGDREPYSMVVFAAAVMHSMNPVDLQREVTEYADARDALLLPSETYAKR